MKKHLFVTLTLLLSSTVLGALAMADKDEPPEPPPIFSTRVVNDEAEPVPVTGIVTVGNFPAALTVEGTVDIGNLPAVQSVEVTNLPPQPLKEPFNTVIRMDLTPVGDDLGEATELYFVPSDKQLTVETVSMRLGIESGAEARMEFGCRGEQIATHFLQPWRSLNAYFPDDEVLLATESIKCHIGPGDEFGCYALSTDVNANGFCLISGYLEDVPE